VYFYFTSIAVDSGAKWGLERGGMAEENRGAGTSIPENGIPDLKSYQLVNSN
jgi:hypothetical protein